MSNTKQARTGDIIRAVSGNFDITQGKLYYAYDVQREPKVHVKFYDDKGNKRAFWHVSEYEIVGNLNDVAITPKPGLKDIKGNVVQEGDTVAYAFTNGHNSAELELFEVQKIVNDGIAVGRSLKSDIAYNLGVFEQRAIKVANAA
jgi:hypothetical protein